MGLCIWPGARRLIWVRVRRITLNNDFSCIWQVGMSCRQRKVALQCQKGMFPIVLVAYHWWCALPSPTSSALRQGEALLTSSMSLSVQKPQIISVCQSWGPGDTWLVVQCPGSRGGHPCLRGESSGERPGTAEEKRASASGKGASKNKNILVDCFAKCCKTVNIYMEIWVLNNC